MASRGTKASEKHYKRIQQESDKDGNVRRRAEPKDHVWSVDLLFARTINASSLKMLVVFDKFTRECIAFEVGCKRSSDGFLDVLADLLSIRRVPHLIRIDNGPQFIVRRVGMFLASSDVGKSWTDLGRMVT